MEQVRHWSDSFHNYIDIQIVIRMFCGRKSSLFEREVENNREKRNINLKGLDHCSYYIHVTNDFPVSGCYE